MRLQAILGVVLGAVVFSSTLAAAEPIAAKRPKIGLVLGGGGARGLAHVGVLEQLERLRVPIDCIAGTSAGALVGGVYSSGMPLPDIRKRVESVDWEKLIGGVPDRRNLPYLRKQDDFKNLAAMTLGLDAEGVKLPRSVVNSQFIDAFLRELTQDQFIDSFAKLPIPFVAIATDLESGDMRVFKSGDLAIALRASMAVPGAFDVVHDSGRMYVDGMFVRNLPVENIKSKAPEGCGADIVIVVDVGTPMLKRDDIKSFLDVAVQAMNIATGRNVQESRKLIGPDDVLIEPDLDGYSPASFTDAKDIIERGRKSVASVEARLAELAIPEQDYQAWASRVSSKAPKELVPYDRVEVASTRFVPAKRVEEVLTAPPAPASQDELLKRFDKLYDSGDFDGINYRLNQEGGQRVATVAPIERHVGPNYLRFGVDLSFDTYRTANVALLANYQMTWLNQWGAQWRNFLRLGAGGELESEIYQPLWSSPVFAYARAEGANSLFPVYSEEGSKLLELEIRRAGAEAGIGYSLGRYGEVRTGLLIQKIRNEATTGIAGTLTTNTLSSTVRGLRLTGVVDQLDNPKWPRHGYYLRTDYGVAKMESENSSRKDSQLLSIDADLVETYATYTVRGSARLRGSLERELAGTPAPYQLGGFLQLSGLRADQLVGAQTALARVMVYKQISTLLPQLGSGTYIGGSLESGKVWNQLVTHENTPTIPSASVYLGVDTLLGPLYMAVGWSDYMGGKWGGYLYLGYTK
ncbi:patatin-like phospholipase family protein [Niveibacterium microcysteis]|uniref:Patatin-like phospholipase family protein n=1 Tax=Niveibacterium microcysteis TaxID=2811415 RepID=A0ABX7M6P7_9RHOO|nr:patatin-like phospholipase family protein [Niveibacterium microcysteis]QSI76591.1 patatin-like phospholipase family protein [Niveibacterium microcysteis]